MENDENNAGGAAEDLELEVVDVTASDTQGDDPFDLIEDEKVRADAKKYRAIANRHKVDKPGEPAKPEKVSPQPLATYVTKDDMARIATREAKELVGKEIADEYDELVKIPLGGYDSLDAKSIAENLKERYAILKARKSPVEKKEDVSGLSATSVVAGTGAGSGKETKSEQKDPPNFHKPAQPEDWYPKKKE